jgi:hypothetical protein
MTPKMVMFTIDGNAGGGAAPVPNAQDNANHDGKKHIPFYMLLFIAESKKLEDMIRDLSASLTSVKHEQEYMEVRERVHRSSELFGIDV